MDDDCQAAKVAKRLGILQQDRNTERMDATGQPFGVKIEAQTPVLSHLETYVSRARENGASDQPLPERDWPMG